MDRSFLSQPEVIAASRRFVCVRLTTYENKEEGEYLKAFQVTRSGELENTVFAILSPDGRKELAHASRSARHTFGSARRMAEAMDRIAREHPGKAVNEVPALPTVRNLRLAVDVAACDNRPLVVVFAPDSGTRRRLEERLRPLAWAEPFLGRFTYVAVSDAKELARIEGAKGEAGILLVQPDRFGLKGSVLKQVAAGATRDELAKGLQEEAAKFHREPAFFGSHVRAGHEAGIFWETVLPVTDPMEYRARERGRRLRGSE